MEILSTFMISSWLAISILSVSAIDFSILQPSFENFCNSSIRCNSRQFLKCFDETCQCMKPKKMTFDLAVKSCVTLAGESCTNTVFSKFAEKYRKIWSEDVKCLPNARCNSEEICECESDFYEISNGTCQPKGLYGAECELDGQCRGDLSLKCVDGTCTCGSENGPSKYDFKRQTCVGLAGKPCVDQRCVSNGECEKVYHPSSFKNGQFIDSGYFYGCICNPETEMSPEGLCLIPHQEKCDDTYPDSNCLPTLKCQDEMCVCPYEDYQNYDYALKGCTTLVGGPCGNISVSKPSWEAPCTTHSSCTPTQEDQVSECKCDPGFVKSLDNKCELGFGQACPSGSLNCGKEQGLYCINGKCDCKDGLQTYDFKLSGCRGLVGSICSEMSFCFEGSECKTTYAFDSLGGICRCKEGFTLDGYSRTCDKIVVQKVSEIQS